MRGRIGLRARLTIFVTAVFAIAVTVTAAIVVSVVEDRLIADTRANAEAVLSDYLESVYGGVASVGVVDPEESTTFFYLDANGDEISELQYIETIVANLDPGNADDSVVGASGGIVVLDSVTGVVTDSVEISTGADGDELAPVDAVEIPAWPVPVGSARSVDAGSDVVAVAQSIEFGDETIVAVGVSAPLRPVTDSLDAIVSLLWILVPLLIAAVAMITWLAATRALRPIAAITDQADAISSSHLDRRVPVPEARDEVRHLAVTVNHMLGRLEHAQQRQRQLVADASHELRSPVAASRAQLEVAVAHPDSVDWHETAAVVLAEQDQLATLISDLLTLAELDEAEPTSLGDVDLDDVLHAEATRHALPVTLHIGEPVRVAANPALITRAVRNLVDNACRHAESAVAVSLTRSGQRATVSVDDDGPGVTPEDRERIFTRFGRADASRTRGEGGAGLGLAIAQQVAKAHGGDVTCTNSPMGGARFVLTLRIDGGVGDFDQP